MAGLLKSFTKTIAVAATPEAIYATSKIASEVVIRADVDNAGDVFIGDSTGQFYPIHADEVFKVAQLAYTRFSPKRNDPTVDIGQVYIKVANNGDTVHVAYIDRS